MKKTTISENIAADLFNNITLDQFLDLQAAEERGEIAAAIIPIIQEVREGITEQEIQENILQPAGGAAALFDQIKEELRLKVVEEFTQSEEYTTLKATVKAALTAAADFVKNHAKDFDILPAPEELKSLAPFIQMELDELPAESEPLPSLLDILTAPEKYQAIIEQAKQRRAELDAAENDIDNIEQAIAAGRIPRITARTTKKVNYPVDKINSNVWSLVEETEPDGQIRFNFNMAKKGSKEPAIVTYALNFSDLPEDAKITKDLTRYDKRVYVACGDLFNAGNEITTATQIYKTMGNTDSPAQESIKKINDSITKLKAAIVTLDNLRETQAVTSRKRFKYDASLLPCERITAYVNGRLCDSAIHFFREPPLLSFAKERRQVTTFPREVLESKIRKTENNLRIEDYLIERIGRAKNSKSNAPAKILYETIYKKCNITSPREKQRAPKKIMRYLDHYTKVNWIGGYETMKDGVTILLSIN